MQQRLHMVSAVKALCAALLLTVGALTGMGCGSGNDDEPHELNGRVRVVHASPDAPNVDVYVDNQRVLSNVPYRQFSGYLPVRAGNRNIRVTPANVNTDVINANVFVAGGEDYTILATGRVADLEPLVLNDDNTAPAAGNIRLRLVHASPADAAASVDIYVTAPGADINAIAPTLSGVPFRAASNYLSVPAGDYRVRITPAGTKTVVIDTGTVSLPAGAIRTGVAVGDPSVNTAAGGAADLGALLLADN
ncbi:MAG: hypothetical protein OHK0029_01290 [Armatimonadaceae bacterium]